MDPLPSAAHVDRSTTDRIRRQGGEALLINLSEMFLERSPERLAGLIASSDPAAISDSCHAFKSSCRLIGALRLGQLCEQLERTTKSGQPASAKALRNLQDEYDRVRPWVEGNLRAARSAQQAGRGAREEAPLAEMRRTSPWPAVLMASAIITVSVLLWQALDSAERRTLDEQTSDALALIQSETRLQLETGIDGLARMAHRWVQSGGTPQEEWAADARRYVSDFGHFNAIEWVDATFKVQWVIPTEGNKQALGLYLGFETRRLKALTRARDRREIVASSAVDLVQGGRGMLVYCPLFVGLEFQGFILGVYRLRPLLDGVLGNVSPGYCLSVREGEDVLYSRGQAGAEATSVGPARVSDLHLRGVTWQLAVWPDADLIAARLTLLPEFVLIGGCLAALLTALILHLAQVADRRARQFELANSRLRSATQQQAAAEARALHAQKLEALGVLAGGIAHDFNNLLTGVLGRAELAREALSEGSSASELLARIETAAERAAELCHQLLAYAGRGETSITTVDLGALVREMTQLLEVSVGSRVPIELVFDEGLHVVEVDAPQIRQVLMNLVMNASEAMIGSGGRVTVRVGRLSADAEFLAACSLGTGLAPGDYASLEVSDTGCGMGQQTRQRIFEPFFSTKSTGRGLGMAAVFGIIRDHAGEVHIRSEPGEGSTICLILPTCDQGVLQEDGMDDQKEGEPLRRDGTILVVDDEEDIRALVGALLAQSGYRTLFAADGAEALAIVARAGGAISAVLLDLTMPGLGGAGTFQRFREGHPELPVVLCSGYTERDAIDQLGCEGSAGFLQKPFRKTALLDSLDRALGTASGQDA